MKLPYTHLGCLCEKYGDYLVRDSRVSCVEEGAQFSKSLGAVLKKPNSFALAYIEECFHHHAVISPRMADSLAAWSTEDGFNGTKGHLSTEQAPRTARSFDTQHRFDRVCHWGNSKIIQHCWCSIPLPSPPRGRLPEQVSTLTTFRGPTMMMMTMMTIYRAWIHPCLNSMLFALPLFRLLLRKLFSSHLFTRLAISSKTAGHLWSGNYQGHNYQGIVR